MQSWGGFCFLVTLPHDRTGHRCSGHAASRSLLPVSLYFCYLLLWCPHCLLSFFLVRISCWFSFVVVAPVRKTGGFCAPHEWGENGWLGTQRPKGDLLLSGGFPSQTTQSNVGSQTWAQRAWRITQPKVSPPFSSNDHSGKISPMSGGCGTQGTRDAEKRRLRLGPSLHVYPGLPSQALSGTRSHVGLLS